MQSCNFGGPQNIIPDTTGSNMLTLQLAGTTNNYQIVTMIMKTYSNSIRLGQQNIVDKISYQAYYHTFVSWWLPSVFQKTQTRSFRRMKCRQESFEKQMV